ncbi:MAG: hypothetical protein RL595_1957 [Planctomycetota bacterium]
MSDEVDKHKPRKFYIINNGMKDLRGHYFETAVSIAQAAKDLGWHPILCAHSTCETGLTPEWLEFYPVFRTDHWMAGPAKPFETDEIQINLAKYRNSNIENLKFGMATFDDYIASRFFIPPHLISTDVFQNSVLKKTFKRIKQIHKEQGTSAVFKKATKKILKEITPPFIIRIAKKVVSKIKRLWKKNNLTINQTLDMTTENYYSSIFKADLSKILAITNAQQKDYVILPTAHGRELFAINELCNEVPTLPSFGLEFRHALEFPLVPLPDGQEHAYVKHHRYYFEETLKNGLKSNVKLFTDTRELVDDYVKFSGMPFKVLPIPFRQTFLENHRIKLPKENEKLHLIYLGDPREEKGFHWLPYLMDFLADNYLKTGRVKLEIQASVHLKHSEIKCINALKILQAYPKEWITFHGLEGPLSPGDYYELIAKGHINLCPYEKETYRSRSSGTLTEAIAAGMPTIVPDNTWLSSQQPLETGLSFNGLDDFLNKTCQLIDNYSAFFEKAKSAKDEWLRKQDPKNLILEAVKESNSAHRAN